VGEGREALAKRVSDRLERGGELTATYGALSIRMALDGPLASAWADGHISVGTLWDLYTRYPYLDRLRDRAVLIAAIRSVLTQITWEREGFALAATYDNASGRYAGLVLTGDPGDPTLTDDWLLVRPDTALAQREADEAEAARPTRSDHEAASGGADPIDSERDSASANVTAAAAGAAAGKDSPPVTIKSPTRFFGAYNVSADRYGRDFAKVSQEILAHLAAAAGTDLEVTIEIHATNPHGFTADTVRTVNENANTLRFDPFGFETE